MYENKLPAYTTDTFDHEREAAENMWNERLEAAPISEKLDSLVNNQCCGCCCSCGPEDNYYEESSKEQELRDRIHSCGLESESSSLDYQSSNDIESETDSEDEIFYGAPRSKQQYHWNLSSSTLPSTPRPPKTLLDLIHRMGLKEL